VAAATASPSQMMHLEMADKWRDGRMVEIILGQETTKRDRKARDG